MTATLGDEHEGGADALHDGDWVELARLDDLLRAAQDLFEAHPPATLYEDGGLIPPAGSACTMYPYPWWYHGFHLDDVTEKGMRALEVKETNRRVVVDHRWRDELAHERRGEMARSPLPPEIARGPPLNSADSSAFARSFASTAVDLRGGQAVGQGSSELRDSRQGLRG